MAESWFQRPFVNRRAKGKGLIIFGRARLARSGIGAVHVMGASFEGAIAPFVC